MRYLHLPDARYQIILQSRFNPMLQEYLLRYLKFNIRLLLGDFTKMCREHLFRMLVIFNDRFAAILRSWNYDPESLPDCKHAL